MSELCALYFSRTLLESLSGTPFRDDVESAFDKLVVGADAAHAAVPRSAAARHRHQGRSDAAPRQPAPAAVHRARARGDAAPASGATSPTTRSRAIGRRPIWCIPYRLAYAQGGLYLLAYVPEYGEVRTFAVERIQDISLLEERFTPIEELPDAAFPHSLGVHSGPPERVEIEFEPAVADYVRAREWHPSQQLRDDATRAA